MKDGAKLAEESMANDDSNDHPATMVTRGLVESAARGDHASLAALLNCYEVRLQRMIALRMDARLSRRVDVDDVMQEVRIAASQHLGDYVRGPDIPFYVWLRGVATNVLLELHRRHLGIQMRDVRREVPLPHAPWLDASSDVLADCLVDSATSPSRAAMRDELKARLLAVIDRLPAGDKEVIALRHFEQLSPAETAQVLQIHEKAAGMRYLRALKRLRDQLDELPGGASAWRL